MGQITTSDKINQNKSIIDNKFKIKIRQIMRPGLSKIARTKIKYKVIKKNKMNKINNHPIILDTLFPVKTSLTNKINLC